MAKEMMASADTNVKAVHAACEAVGEHEMAAALADGAAAGIPWQDLLKAALTMALPIFVKWVQDWIAGNKQPVPSPKMP